MTNVEIARALRQIDTLHQASWDKDKRRYTRPCGECIQEVVGNDPIALLFGCLFAVGYCEMWDFCDKVLGPQSSNE